MREVVYQTSSHFPPDPFFLMLSTYPWGVDELLSKEGMWSTALEETPIIVNIPKGGID